MRSIEAPFRREFPITTTGIVGEVDIYIGDIKTLYVSSISPGSLDVILRGKIGQKGQYVTIPFTMKENRGEAVDVSGIEYLRIEVLKVIKTTTLSIFGYYDQTKEKTATVALSSFDRNINNQIESLLEGIRDQLIILNQHMTIITDEEIEQED